MRRWLCMLLTCCVLAATTAAAGLDERTLHAPFDRLLQQHVRWNAEGTASTVDYLALANDQAALTTYLDALATVPSRTYETWPLASRQAFLINAYNAQTLALVLTGGPDLQSIKDLGGWFSSPWKQRFFTLLGSERSLDELEHALLRGAPEFAEPRIHFAVNCASIGCPALRPEAYSGASLDAQLEDQTRRFLRDRSRNRVDLAAGELVVSKIFAWYAEDFALGFRGSRSVAEFLALYAEELAPDVATALRAALADDTLEIEYSTYDWALNRRP